MEKVNQTSSLMYFCKCTSVYLTRNEILHHLKLPNIHRINKFIPTSLLINKYAKLSLNQIHTITQIQSEIQKSSINLIQTITKNTETVLKNLNHVKRVYKDLIKYKTNDKILFTYDIKSTFKVRDSLAKEMFTHFEQRILDKSLRSDKTIKKIKNQAFKILNDCSFRLECLGISSDEKILICGDICGGIRLWDMIANMQISYFMKHKSEVTSLALGTGDDFMLSGSCDCSVRYWNLQSRKHIYKFEGHTNAVSNVVVSEDNKFGYSGSHDKSIIIWNLPQLSIMGKIFLFSSISNIDLLRKSNVLVASDTEGNLTFWNPINKECLKIIKENDFNIACMSFSEDEKYFILGYFDGTISVYLTEEYLNISSSKINTSVIIAVDISPDSKNFVSSTNLILLLWNLVDMEVLFSFNYSMTTLKKVFYSKFSHNLILLSSLSQIIYKSLENYDDVIKLNFFNSQISQIAISCDLKYMAYGNTQINLIHVEDEKIISTSSEKSFIRLIQFSSNNSYLVISSFLSIFCIFEVPSLIILKEMDAGQLRLENLAISNNFNFVSCVLSDNILKIFSTKNNFLAYCNQSCIVYDMTFCLNDEKFIFIEPPNSLHILNKDFLELRVLKFSQDINFIIQSEFNKILFIRNYPLRWVILDSRNFGIIVENKSRKEILQLSSERFRLKYLNTLKVPFFRVRIYNS